MPFSEIARRLDVSPGMIRQRFQRLVREKALQVTVVTNRLALGDSMMALVGIKADSSRLDEIAEEIARQDEVIYLVALAGNYNLLAEVGCHDHQHVLRFLTRLGSISGVRDFETFVHLKIIKEIYS